MARMRVMGWGDIVQVVLMVGLLLFLLIAPWVR